MIEYIEFNRGKSCRHLSGVSGIGTKMLKKIVDILVKIRANVTTFDESAQCETAFVGGTYASLLKDHPVAGQIL